MVLLINFLIGLLVGGLGGAAFGVFFLAPLLIHMAYPKLCKAGHFRDVYVATVFSLPINWAFRKEVGDRLDAIERVT